MELIELEAIYLVNLCGGYVQAANYSGIPISTLSRRVSRAEARLGLEIFDRKRARSSVTPTENGRILIPLINKLINTRDLMTSRLEALKTRTDRPLTVGKPSMLGSIGDNAIISGYLHENPRAEVLTVIRSDNELIRLLNTGSIDCSFFAIVGGSDDADALMRSLKKENYSLFTLRVTHTLHIGVSERDELAGKNEVSIQELRGRTFIFNQWHDVPRQAVGKGPALFEHLGVDSGDYHCHYEDHVNPDYIYGLVAGGMGVLPQIFCCQQPVKGVRFLRLKEWDREARSFLIVRNDEPTVLKDFIQYVTVHTAE